MRVQPFHAIYPDKSLVASPHTFFGTISENFTKHLNSGMYTTSNKEGMYVYQIKYLGIKYRGIVNNTEIGELTSGKILLHEDTLVDKEQDMVESTLDRKAMIKPVLLFHKKNKKLSRFINQVIEKEPKFYSYELEDGSIHQIWKITNEERLETLKNIFLFGIRKAYVADGHHRCKVQRRLHKKKPSAFKDMDFSKVLTAYFSEDQMEIYDHVKVVDILGEIKPEVFIAELSEYASVRLISKFAYPDKFREFLILMNGEMYKGKWRKKVLKDFEVSPDALDAYIMNQIVFRLIFKIPDLRKDPRISYFSGRESMKSIMQRSKDNPHSVCILQAAPCIDDIKKFANKKRTFPPKSTWFEPRIKSGIIAQKL